MASGYRTFCRRLYHPGQISRSWQASLFLYTSDVNDIGLPVLGDFEEIYGSEDGDDEPHTGQWDAVLTCFFIDPVSQCHSRLSYTMSTRFQQAKNIVNNLRVIHRILAPGGVWINLGTFRRERHV